MYLCPTRQLVNQVTEQSLIKYGIKANALLENNLTIFLQAKNTQMQKRLL